MPGVRLKARRKMLEKVKLALRVSNSVFDPEILDMISAAVADLQLPGAVFMAIPVTGSDGSLTDYNVDDPLVARAIITYCRMNFGSPADYDRLKAAYDEQKGQMRENSRYGMTEA